MDDGKTTGVLLGIAVRPQPGAPMGTLDQVPISKEKGLAGDGREQSRRRQVTVLAKESWEAACNALSKNLPWTARRANLLIEGISLEDSRDRIIKVGEVVLEITGETKPCEIMEAKAAGLKAALTPHWRGGITCRVLEPGVIQIGDLVELQQ